MENIGRNRPQKEKEMKPHQISTNANTSNSNSNIIGSNSSSNPNPPQVPTLLRREELLQSARKYRNKFVLSAVAGGADVQSKLQAVVAFLSPQNSGSSSATTSTKGGKKNKDKGGKDRGVG